MTSLAEVLADAIRSRRSVRRFRKGKVAREAIERLVDAARWAPSAHNAQPWRFIVLEDDVRRKTLAQAMAERFEQDLRTDGMETTDAHARASRAEARLVEAPAAILVCLTLEEAQDYTDAVRARAEREMAVQSTALAVENLLLAAHAEGLGACWLCSPLFCPELVVHVLSLPTAWEPQALILLGTPENVPTAPNRRPVSDVLAWR
jgi:coenzyme F420-0:L-glutamate ligase/coenzyme F420-1:gamma-L-glutamate ligase